MRQRPFLKATGWLVGWNALMWITAVLYRLTLADHVAAGQCDGIGFGCVPSPRDGMTLAMYIIGVPVTGASVLVGLPWIAVWRRRWPTWLVGTTAFLVAVGFALLVLWLLNVL